MTWKSKLHIYTQVKVYPYSTISKNPDNISKEKKKKRTQTCLFKKKRTRTCLRVLQLVFDQQIDTINSDQEKLKVMTSGLLPLPNSDVKTILVAKDVKAEC
jgi:transcription initiation factor IIF auxiliary subunit